MDSQGSIASVVSETGRDWLDLILPAPQEYTESDVDNLQETVRTYFDFPECDSDPDELPEFPDVSDDDVDQLHDDDWLDLSPEDAKETVVNTNDRLC